MRAKESRHQARQKKLGVGVPDQAGCAKTMPATTPGARAVVPSTRLAVLETGSGTKKTTRGGGY